MQDILPRIQNYKELTFVLAKQVTCCHCSMNIIGQAYVESERLSQAQVFNDLVCDLCVTDESSYTEVADKVAIIQRYGIYICGGDHTPVEELRVVISTGAAASLRGYGIIPQATDPLEYCTGLIQTVEDVLISILNWKAEAKRSRARQAMSRASPASQFSRPPMTNTWMAESTSTPMAGGFMHDSSSAPASGWGN